ncbi:MAG: hypothetical protein JWM41_1006 [Gemmatimonadetes bacterium]|nr:hypothetical protein [Gemmatimonadota bacterium]
MRHSYLHVILTRVILTRVILARVILTHVILSAAKDRFPGMPILRALRALRMTHPSGALGMTCVLAATALAAQTPDSATLATMRWRSIGPVNMAGRITDVEGDPKNPKTFYITGADGGIWKTINAGTSFIPLWEHAPIASMGDLAIAPSDPKILYAGTGEDNARNSVSPGFGVYKSVDGGVTWQSVGLEKTQHVGRIVVHPTNPNIVYVAAVGATWASNPERGLYKTVDGGKSWTLVKFISDKAGFVDVVMDPRDPNTLYAASWERSRGPYFLKSGGPGSALWKTTDAGKSWREIKGGGFPETMKGRMNIQVAHSDPNVVYAMVEADSVRGAKPQRLLSGLYRSADAGKTWKWMSTIDNRPFYFSQIRVDPKNANRLYRMAVDFASSDDGGYSWRLGMVGNHEDYHGMWIDPNDPEHFIIGGDAGIFQTWDRGGTYDSMNNMAMGQFYVVSYDYQVPYRVCGGLQDNGSSCGWSRRRNGQLQMTDWFSVFAADGLYTAQDPLDPNQIYYESQGGNIARRDLGTGETINIKPRTVSIATYGQQISAIKGAGGALTPDQDKQIADIRARMKRDMADPNAALRWNWNTPFFVSAHDPNVFYSGAEKVFKSVRKGRDPVAISTDLSAHDPTWIRVSGGFDEEGNAAPDASGGITRDATGAEENATISVMTESTIRPGLLYVGTDDGKVWLTRNDGGKWEDLSDRYSGVPAMTHVSGVEPSHFDSATVYVTLDNHRRGDFKPYVFMSSDWGRTFHSISANLPTDRPGSAYVIREDLVNPNLLYVGTETGVFASLNKGQSWFPLQANLPTVPVYDLKIHPRDHELIAATHGRAIQVLDVAPLQQMNASVLAAQSHLFAPTVAFEYGQMIPSSETRAQRPWKGDGGPSGAEIEYRLSAPAPGPVRVLIVDAAGDTIARLAGTNVVGVNHVSWNLQPTTDQSLAGGGGGGGGRGGAGRGGAPEGLVNVPGYPAGFNPRPAEPNVPADTSGSPTAQARALAAPGAAGRGGRGGGGGGFGRGNTPAVATGDYRVVLDAGGQKQMRILRVVRVAPGDVSVMAPIRER